MKLRHFGAVAVAALLSLAAVDQASAIGLFYGLPTATLPLTGLESMPADTQASQGINPATEYITTAQMQSTAAQVSNVLVCGDFGTCPWQRGTGTSADISSTLTYWADRWANLGAAGSAINVSRQTGANDVTAGYGASLRFQRKSANADINAICMGQTIESADSYQFQSGTAVLSFHALAGANFSAASNNVQVTIATGTGVDGSTTNLFAGGWTGYANTYQANTAISTTWTRYTVAVAIPATAKQIGVKFCYTPVGTAGANDWLELAGVTLTKTILSASALNGQPTLGPGYQRLPIELETLRAQRYYIEFDEGAAGPMRATGEATTTTNARIFVKLPVTMRAAPTGTYTAGFAAAKSDGTAQACTALGTVTSSGTTNSITVDCTVSANLTAGNGTALIDNGGSGVIKLSADL